MLLINARIEKWKVPAGLPILNGNYVDFTAEWYATVGTTIAFSLFFASVMPWTNFIFALIKYLTGCIDRGCSTDRRKTK